MIQRIQSIYLFIAGVLAAVFTFINEHALQLISKVGIEEVGASLVALVSLLLSVLTIFLFKNRTLQIRLIWLTMFFLLLSIGLYVFIDGVKLFYLDWQFYLLPLGIFVLWLAKNGVQKDEKLIKSSYRLR